MDDGEVFYQPFSLRVSLVSSFKKVRARINFSHPPSPHTRHNFLSFSLQSTFHGMSHYSKSYFLPSSLDPIPLAFTSSNLITSKNHLKNVNCKCVFMSVHVDCSRVGRSVHHSWNDTLLWSHILRNLCIG